MCQHKNKNVKPTFSIVLQNCKETVIRCIGIIDKSTRQGKKWEKLKKKINDAEVST